VRIGAYTVAIVIAFGKITAVFWVTLLFDGEVQVCLADIILAVYFFLCKSGSNHTEESSVMYLRYIQTL
jgi:hypothetical protein